MKPRLITSLVAVLFATLQTTFAQSTFQNLDFEAANIQPGQAPGFIPIADALPGWSGRIYTNGVGGAAYNEVPLNASTICIFDRGFQGGGSVIDGNYTAFLYAGIVAIGGPSIILVPGDTSIFQSSLVPVGSQSLLFKSSGGLVVTMAGQQLPLANLGNGLYGADIHQWAGQTVELNFTLHANTINPSLLVGASLDDIQFSPSTIPEPGVSSLAGLGAVLLSLRCVGRPKAPQH